MVCGEGLSALSFLEFLSKVCEIRLRTNRTYIRISIIGREGRYICLKYGVHIITINIGSIISESFKKWRKSLALYNLNKILLNHVMTTLIAYKWYPFFVLDVHSVMTEDNDNVVKFRIGQWWLANVQKANQTVFSIFDFTLIDFVSKW